VRERNEDELRARTQAEAAKLIQYQGADRRKGLPRCDFFPQFDRKCGLGMARPPRKRKPDPNYEHLILHGPGVWTLPELIVAKD
jgi:hypothetical protein